MGAGLRKSLSRSRVNTRRESITLFLVFVYWESTTFSFRMIIAGAGARLVFTLGRKFKS